MEKTLELDQDTYDENVPVSSTDEQTSDGGSAADRTRKLGEFSQTNSPLSDDEIKKRRTRGWGVIRKPAEPDFTRVLRKIHQPRGTLGRFARRIRGEAKR